MSHAVFHSDTDISVGKRKNWVKSVTNSLFRCKVRKQSTYVVAIMNDWYLVDMYNLWYTCKTSIIHSCSIK